MFGLSAERNEVERPARIARKRVGPGSLLPGEGAGVQWTPLSRRLRSADRAGRRDEPLVALRRARNLKREQSLRKG